ncbi:MAG: hypothetical protein J6J71_09335 [Prevotella sp.]|nr:hypothetical protein [Paludibacteraceae bacterium]MBP3574009.1 hypothetical protein [Prevotella sp.]MBP3574775.1 hypothetical protein [Prevotella sp.]
MKKVFLLLAVCTTMMAHASTYNFLVFTNTEGTNTIFNVKNLTLNVEGSDLLITNAEGTVSMLLTAMKSMQFSEDGTVSAVENILNADTPVQVFSVSGTSLGVYGSLMEAAQTLNAGAYVISNGSVTQTIVVK